MTKVVMEAAALGSALAAAARIAPTRGDAFEKAAGILLEITADECVVKATDTLVFYSTWLTPEQFEGEPVSWRLPSRIFSELVTKLRTVREKTLTLEDDGQTLKLTHGRTRASFMLLPADRFPHWQAFSPDDMFEVHDLGKAVSAVVWAAAKNGDPPLIAVNLDGESVLATDRYKFASAPCKIPLEEAITLPPAAITSVLKTNHSIMMRVEGSQVYIMPDDYTQISMTAYGVAYPPVQRLMIREHPVSVTIKKQDLLDTIDLAMTMAGADRMPTLHLIFGKQEIAAMVRNDEVGLVGDVMSVPGQLDFSNRHEIRFVPDNLLGALNGCVGNDIRIGFNPEDSRQGVFFTGDEGVAFWVAPRQKSTPGDSDS